MCTLQCPVLIYRLPVCSTGECSKPYLRQKNLHKPWSDFQPFWRERKFYNYNY